MKENILFTSAGDNTNFFNLWCSDNRSYDIFICYYGYMKTPRYKEYSDFYLQRKGSKIQNFYYAWTNNISNIQHYKRFYIVDDDIIINTNEINELFNLLRDLDLWMLQPSFNSTRSKISHEITRQLQHSKYRYTNFIEINTPFFSHYAISLCMEKYNTELTGYGIDILFINILGIENDSKYVIVDYISCINPRRKSEIDSLQPIKERLNIWNKLRKSLKLPDIIHTNFYYIK